MDNVEIQNLTNNYWMITLFGLGIIVLGFFWLRAVVAKNPGLPIGELINKGLLREKISVFVIVLIIINIAEGMMAASITPIGETPLNQVSRFLVHFSIQVMCIVVGIYLPIMFIRILGPSPNRGLGIFIFLTLLLGAFFLPLLNLAIIANFLKQSILLNLFLLDLFPWNDMTMVYEAYGLPPDFSPWANMAGPMVTGIALLIPHFFLVFLDGLFIIYSPNKALKEIIDHELGIVKKPVPPATPAGTPAGSAPSGSSSDPISFILEWFFASIQPEALKLSTIDRQKQRSHTAHDSIRDAAKKQKLETSLRNLKAEIVTYKNTENSLDAASKTAKINAIDSKIKELWPKSNTEGEGFGFSLSANHRTRPNP